MTEMMITWWASFKRFFEKKDGQALVEYALILVLVAIAVIVALRLLGTQVGATFDTISGELGGAS
ncbi:MAG: Flp/Fap pilin component [Deltaproteobacteria bacterium]|nr:Flp/Fap pilin component [Deltaproteobacteria bacterium]